MNGNNYVYIGVAGTVVGVAGMAYAAQDDIRNVFSNLPVVGGMV